MVVSGIAYDLGTSNRAGTRFGPRALRQASSHIAWGPQWPYDFDPTHRLAIVDWGDHAFHIGYVDHMLERVEANTLAFLQAGCFPMTMGGDHFVTLPLLRAAAEAPWRRPVADPLRRPPRHDARAENGSTTAPCSGTPCRRA